MPKAVKSLLIEGASGALEGGKGAEGLLSAAGGVLEAELYEKREEMTSVAGLLVALEFVSLLVEVSSQDVLEHLRQAVT